MHTAIKNYVTELQATKPESKNIWRYRHRWKDYIKIELKEI
jgi:hypothetical protein